MCLLVVGPGYLEECGKGICRFGTGRKIDFETNKFIKGL